MALPDGFKGSNTSVWMYPTSDSGEPGEFGDSGDSGEYGDTGDPGESGEP